MMDNLNNRVAVIICTYNRVLDAKINQEIIRYLWPEQSKLLKDVVIIHSYNGKQAWYPESYLEDATIRSPNSNLSQGNADLIDNAFFYIRQQYPYIKYAVVVNADTWLIKPSYIENCVSEMDCRDFTFAASSYVGEKCEFFRGGLASDFFIVNLPFAESSGLFPIDYKKFMEEYGDLILYYSADMAPILEKLLFARLSAALLKNFPVQNPSDLIYEKLLRLKEREPFYKPGSDVERIWYWHEAGVLSHHCMENKIKVLTQEKISCNGKYFKEILNRGVSKEAA